MNIARKIEATCTRCGENSDVWRSEKEEPTMKKEHYTCETCGSEWAERR
jgi:DNA-directed RNA polymerase subunit M/transcription elongation factor TFIIS